MNGDTREIVTAIKAVTEEQHKTVIGRFDHVDSILEKHGNRITGLEIADATDKKEFEHGKEHIANVRSSMDNQMRTIKWVLFVVGGIITLATVVQGFIQVTN